MKIHPCLFALCLVVSARAADPLPDFGLPFTELRFGSVTVYSENDKYFAGTDQHYTNGFKISALSSNLANFSDNAVPGPVQDLGNTFDRFVDDGDADKLGFAVGQNIYTPANTRTAAFQPGDRPYAAWLYVGATFQIYQPEHPTALGRNTVARLDSFDLSLGMVGPGALGRQVQNDFHDLIGVDHANGWDNQIHNEPGLILAYERKWRISTAGARTGWGADLIPHLGASAGNIFTYANGGAEARLGWRLPADFGTSLIRPSGDSNSRQRPRWSFFVFGAIDGRAVARDITLDGNTFRESPSIEKNRFVNDLSGGFAVGSHHWQLAYTQARRSREFRGQSRASVFGSISLTFYR